MFVSTNVVRFGQFRYAWVLGCIGVSRVRREWLVFRRVLTKFVTCVGLRLVFPSANTNVFAMTGYGMFWLVSLCMGFRVHENFGFRRDLLVSRGVLLVFRGVLTKNFFG